jgi:hypothetical protein
MKLFTRNNQSYQPLKYLMFLPKHPLYLHTPVIHYIEMFSLQTKLKNIILLETFQGVVNILLLFSAGELQERSTLRTL